MLHKMQSNIKTNKAMLRLLQMEVVQAKASPPPTAEGLYL